MKKRIGIIALALCLLLTMLPSSVFAVSPELTVEDVDFSDRSIKEDETFDMTIKLKNNTSETIDSLYFMLESSSDFKLKDNISKEKVFFKSISGQANTSIEAGQERTFVVSIRNEGATSPVLNFKWLFDENTVDDYVRVPIAETDSSDDNKDENYVPKLVIRRQNGQNVVRPGESFDIELELSNIGQIDAKDVDINVLPSGSFMLSDYDNSENIDRIRDGREETASFDFDVDAACEAGNYSIEFNITYTDIENKLYTETFTSSVTVKESNDKPLLRISKLDFSGEALQIGKPNLVFVNVENSGNITAQDITIRVEGLSSEGITLFNDVAYKEIENIGPNKTLSIPFSFYPNALASGNVQELTLKVDYKDSAEKTYSQNIPLFLNIQAPEVLNDKLTFENLVFPSSGVNVEKDFTIKATIFNQSNSELKNLSVKFDDPNSILIFKTAPEVFISKLEPNGKKEVSFKVNAKESATSNHYPLYLRLSTADGLVKPENTFAYVGTYINNPERGGSNGSKSMPKLIIKDYDFGGDNVTAGEEFELKLQIQNTHNKEFVQNVKMSFTSEDNIFSAVDMANSLFIDKIGSKEIKDIVIKLKAKKNAEVKGYNLVFKFEYEDSKGNAYDVNDQPINSEETITIPIYQPYRLTVDEISIPNELNVGNNYDVEFNFYNMGRSKMFNLMVKLEVENSQVMDSNYYVGDFDSGRQDSFMGSFSPSEAGPITGKIIFTYEDSQGNELEKTETFEAEVMEMEMREPSDFEMEGDFNMGEMPMEPKAGLPLFAKILIGVGIAAIVIVPTVIIVKKKKKKRLAELTEEDDDE